VKYFLSARRSKKWKTGDRVYTPVSLSGTYAEQTLCKHSELHPLPERVSFAQGAALTRALCHGLVRFV
jgi:NADPH:quinone reductase-like Zn-dependent oxidoreductase